MSLTHFIFILCRDIIINILVGGFIHLIITGGGLLGSKLAELVSKEKHDVVLIEKEENIAEELGEKLDVLILHGDATSKKILNDAGIKDCDALVTMTGDDKTNLMVCEVGKSENVPVIVARVNDSTNEGIFMKLGITATINTTTSSVFAFKKALEKPGEKLISLVAGNKAEILELVVTDKSKVNGEKVEELTGKFIVCTIFRDGELVKVKPKETIREGDIVVVCSPVEEVKKVTSLF